MVISPSSRVREALKYITEEMEGQPEASKKSLLSRLIDQAGMRFNLTPIDAKALLHVLYDEKK